MKYRLEYKSTLEQEIWNTDTNKLVVAFTKDDFSVEFNPGTPALLVQHFNDPKSTDKFDQRELINALFQLVRTKNQKQNELIDSIEGLKAGGKALNFILPSPVENPSECITTSELYKTQYALAKEHWGAYYSRFYEKTPTDKDYLVQHVHRSDLFGIRSVDGEWYMTISVGGKGIRKYLGNDENVAKQKRDEIINKIRQ